jgi:hypothetical protein
MHKLQHYGIIGKSVRWIQNWLANRKQSVVIDGSTSDAVRVDSGCKFLEMSSTNSMSCVSQERLFRNPCCSGYRILFSTPCFMILLANICSITLQQRIHLWCSQSGLRSSPRFCSMPRALPLLYKRPPIRTKINSKTLRRWHNSVPDNILVSTWLIFL